MARYLLFRQCSKLIPGSRFVNYSKMVGVHASSFHCLNFRLESRFMSKTIINKHQDLRRLLTTCQYIVKTSLPASFYDDRFVIQCRKWNSQYHLPRNAAVKGQLLQLRGSNVSYSQSRRLSYETPVSSPLQSDGLYKFLSESSPVLKTQELLVSFHDTSGLPWWATVIVTTVILRTLITFPLAVYQYYILAKVENLTTEMSAIVQELKRETAVAIKKFNWTPKEARITYYRSLRKQWNKLVVRDNCHPAKASILLFVQLPMWIFISFALRNLVYMLPTPDAAAQVTYLEMSASSFLWLPNLVAPDASWALPVMLGLTNLVIIEIQALSKLKEPGKLQKFVTNFFRLVSIGMIPIAATVPACLNLYWVTSSTFGLIQNVALMSPRVKAICGIPRTPSTQDKPYQHIATQFKKKTGWLVDWGNHKS